MPAIPAALSADQIRQRAECALEVGGEAAGRRPWRSMAAGDEQRLDPGGHPGRGLGGERVEPALHDRQRPVIGFAGPHRLLELAVAIRRAGMAGDPVDQLQRLAQLGELAAGVGAADGGAGRRVMSHRRRRYRLMANEALTAAIAVAWRRPLGQSGRMFRSMAFAVAFALAAPAAAQQEPAEAPTGVSGSALDVSGHIDLLTDYRFRGVSRSDEDPALQASLNAIHRSGFYAGARGTTLNGLDGLRRRDLGDIELDLYAGFGRELGGGFEIDAGALYYLFGAGAGPTDYVEPYASLSYLIGPVYATAGAKYAPSQRAIGGEDMLYLFGQIEVSVPFRPWSFSAHLGHQDWGRFGSYRNWSLGVEHQLRIGGIPDAAIGLRYVDTDLPSASGRDAGLVGSIGLRF